MMLDSRVIGSNTVADQTIGREGAFKQVDIHVKPDLDKISMHRCQQVQRHSGHVVSAHSYLLWPPRKAT